LTKVGKWFHEAWVVPLEPDEKRKRPPLFLFGPSNSGKSTFIEDVLLKDIPEICRYRPLINESRFGWSSFNPKVHAVGICDEVDIDTIISCKNDSVFKQAVTGDVFPSDKKHCDPLKMKIEIPLIFISQTKWKGDMKKAGHKAIRNRLHFVKARGVVYKSALKERLGEDDFDCSSDDEN
jgi:hypothetical protein